MTKYVIKVLITLLITSRAVAFGCPARSLATPCQNIAPGFRGVDSSHRAKRLKSANLGVNGQSRELRSRTITLNALAIPRGGTATPSILNWVKNSVSSSPANLFNASLIALAVLAATSKAAQWSTSSTGNKTIQESSKPKSIKELQAKFLSVFWLLRCADWLQGPYFYEVYATKMFNGKSASVDLISQLFLTGFAATALFGPVVGSTIDSYGRKKGTLAFAILYAIGAISTKSSLLWVLFFGRVMSGIGTSLLFSAPESWLVGEAQQSGDDPDGSWLGETFGLAYTGDSIVAILAGQLAGAAAARHGPTGPFELSTWVLAIGGVLAALFWKENIAVDVTETTDRAVNKSNKMSILDAIRVVKDDPKIMLVGGVQSLFEAAMYIFVLQWPPAVSLAVAKWFGAGVKTPFGTVFACFMACCLLGATTFGQLAKMAVPTEKFAAAMLASATIAMATATYTVSSTIISLPALVASFFAFEACVGMYFPSIGTLRSKYIPDYHRSVIMNLFGIPLNILVVGVFLSISKLGLTGALGISSGALALATLCMLRLYSLVGKGS